ncbi:RAD55 family ATPase [Salinarchaeum laminariae]|uniref:RAD55 family ATPase n=1 Tax=Salinarchaeum laminariae TaxID=869888 RepID=UPI0020C0DC31|nr:ATPase domain-containing protein [Salinarchaeum laminariae]
MPDLVSTGVEGLDSILNGGITEHSTVLVSGNPGTGKSILGIQYLYTGVLEDDEQGIYVTFEEDAEDVRMAAESIGFDRWSEFVDDGSITILDKKEMLRDQEFSRAVELLLEVVQEGGYDRLVLDSLTMFELFFEDEHERRVYLLKFSDILKANDLTSLLISEQEAVFPETDLDLENFLTDGNVYLIQTPTDSGVSRYVWVSKMRKQNIDTDIFPMEIGQGGITVHEQAGGFSLVDRPGGTF